MCHIIDRKMNKIRAESHSIKCMIERKIFRKESYKNVVKTKSSTYIKIFQTLMQTDGPFENQFHSTHSTKK